jgi:hypothetical protein
MDLTMEGDEREKRAPSLPLAFSWDLDEQGCVRAPSGVTPLPPSPALGIDAAGHVGAADGDLDWYPVVEVAFGPDAAHVVLGREVVPRRCRFCERVAGDATFRQEAHAIPAAIGNRTVFSLEECDDCNGKFGRELEDDFVNFLGPLRTFSGISARRRKVPTFRRSPRSTPIRHGGHGKILVNEEGEGDAVVIHHGADGKSLRLEVEYPPFDLAKVGRALARMALFHLRAGPTSSFHHVLRWVRGDLEWRPQVYEAFVPGGVAAGGVFIILAPPLEHRSHTFIACIALSCAAYFLPLPEQDWTVRDPPWETLLRPFIRAWGTPPKLTRFQASTSGRVTGHRRVFKMRQQGTGDVDERSASSEDDVDDGRPDEL